MKYMGSVPSAGEPLDLIDLKFLPAWVKEDWSAPRRAEWEEDQEPSPRGGEQRRDHPHRRPRREQKNRDRRDRRSRDERRMPDHRDRKRFRDFPARREAPAPPPLPQLDVHFLPQAAAFENVAAQIKSGTVAYSVYALARLFLQKPERYHVRVKTKDARPLFRLGESNAVSTNRIALEDSAFRLMRERFYEAKVTLNDPIKGDFNSVARERTTGTLLGPTNHHSYQPQLRRLYEQRFSRRMSFLDFQRQIENVSDPALVEQWKEEARKVTTFVTREEESTQTFNTEAEAERHFREKYLFTLITETPEAEIDGVTSRRLPDRGIARLIENAWSAEVRSPSSMMQELAGRFRGSGLQIFRHRKGMLFVSPIRLKPIDESAVSDSVRQILETLKASPRINRKELAEKLIAPGTEPVEAEKTKLSLASDLHWMIREGHVIEFNDGSLDLPRAKAPKKEAAEPDAPPGDVSVADGAQTLSSIEVSDSSTEAAVSGGIEAPPPARLTDHEEIQDLPPGTAGAIEEDAKPAVPETATVTSLAEIGSTESRPTD
jgi:hypothetical protein